MTSCLQANAKLKRQTPLTPIEIHGRVVNQEGNPLQGATVLISGTKNGTTTNIEGGFVLTVPGPNTKLEISNVGFQSKTVIVGKQKDITITLEKGTKGLDEVLVVGYGTQSKRNVTSSVSTVTSKDIANYPVQQIGQALGGKISGVQIIQNSGSPGSSLRFRIRGNGSVNNSDPLYVVDGNLGANPDDLDPNNIESIQILKSASASAIYGAQGANGVVLITTKKGVSGVPVLQ
ncbi:MAG: TonB-dependent receptor plug domain-containing protein, partial [Chitinophagaceae bacterium]